MVRSFDIQGKLLYNCTELYISIIRKLWTVKIHWTDKEIHNNHLASESLIIVRNSVYISNRIIKDDI